jgi:UMF1 family MFS transporter
MLFIWLGVCFAAYIITTEVEFFVLAAVVGMIMGGIQSLSRSTYSKLIPENTIDTTSYFSFYDVTYNLSIVVGTFSFGLINQLTGNMRYSAIGLAFYFVVGMALLYQVKSSDIRKVKN